MPLRAACAVLLAALVTAACGPAVGDGQRAPETRSAPPTDTAAPTAGAGPLDVDDVRDAEPPPPDARLAEATWPQMAAWIDRAADAGHPVVVNFFASWCGPCRREAPLLVDASERNPEVRFLGVAYRDFEDDARGFIEENGIGYATLLDFEGRLGRAVGVRGMPTTFFFDASGRLAEVAHGEIDAERLRAGIEAASR